MYMIFNETHRGLAMLSVLATLVWAGMVLLSQAPSVPSGMRRVIYIVTMASTGLVGISGIVVTFMASWYAMIFPWLGLVAVAAHGMAGVRSRKALAAGNKAFAIIAVLIQIICLVAAYGIMTVKPF